MYLTPLRYVYSPVGALLHVVSIHLLSYSPVGAYLHAVFYSLKEALSLIHLINHSILQRLRSGHPVVAVGILTNLIHRLPRVVGDNLI